MSSSFMMPAMLYLISRYPETMLAEVAEKKIERGTLEDTWESGD